MHVFRRPKLSLIVAVLLSQLCLPLAAQVALRGWPLPHFDDARTNFNPNELLLGSANVARLAERWSFRTCPWNDEPPAIANGIVYVTAECRTGARAYTLVLYAVNAATGALIWQRPLGTSPDMCAAPYAPGLSRSAVYVGSCLGMFAFNALTGALLWQNTALGPVLDVFGEGNGVAVADGTIYFAANNRIYALNADTGALVWSFSTLYGTSISPAVSDGVVYVAGSYGPIYALRGDTGAVLWQSSLDPGLVHSPPTVAGGVLYVQAYLGGVHALDAATGTLLWASLDFVDVLGTAGVAYDRVYVTSHQHDGGPQDTYALDAETGAVVWHVTEVGGLVSVAVANGLVYVVNDAAGQIDVLDGGTGDVLTAFGGPGVYSSPVVVNGTVYFTGAGGLHAYGIARPSGNHASPVSGILE